ncbi:site-specific integrase [Enterococcus sp. BWM-S5]|uniref:Site-specific integrase n=1 Tax=Enterococcus larvae TaxID=2794352 RepID=A0ABS4CLD2_9ENTE|nr:site-specific integrase [Enterococcus larvae]MBP1047097.1 site-specific integrase [Enterococcus larvae]
MATFKQYKLKTGEKKWLFKTYLGIDQSTGKDINTTRRGFSSKKEAQLACNKLILDFEKKNILTDQSQIKTFAALYEIWFDQHKKEIKLTTQQRIRIYFDLHILPVLGNIKLADVTPLFCQKTINKWHEQFATYKQLRIYTSMVFKYAILIGVMNDNPMERTITPKKKKSNKKESDNFYSKEELKEFFCCLEKLEDKRAFAFFRILAFAGLRKGEAMALLWKDIDLTNRTINIDKTLAELQSGTAIIQDTKTESSDRVITIDTKTCSILREWKNHTIQQKLSLGIRDKDFENNVVFCNSVLTNKNQYLYKSYANNVMKKVERHFPDMKIIKVHDFRKTNASLLFESGASIKDVSQRLGHKSSKITTDIYIMVTQTKQDQTADEFAEYMAF